MCKQNGFYRFLPYLLLTLTLFCQTTHAVTGKFSGSRYSVCFTPGGDCTDDIVKVINSASKSLYIQTYSFTSPAITKAVIKAFRRGVNVFMLFDKTDIRGLGSKMPDIEAAGIPFLIDYQPHIAHNKVMIIDRKILITGSFNFTTSAQKHNAENVIIIFDQGVAKKYLKNFQKPNS